MIFRQIEAEGLSHYSYLVGCGGAGKAAVIDPRRDIDIYLDEAEKQGVRIAYVLETHIHADYASGARELAEATGAELLVSAYDKGETYEVKFPHSDMRDGESLQLGSVRIEAVHTPGHTPEHLSFVVVDESRSSDTPALMLSGDFLFVGSLGRPDLLGEEAKAKLAASLYHSSRNRLAPLPDGLEIYPGHGAGSMCGAGMSARPLSTLGYERSANPYLEQGLQQDGFVQKILSTVPPFPEYYLRMKKLNSEGPPLLKGLPGNRKLSLEQFRREIDSGAVVLDTRDQSAFGGGHIPGSFGIGLDPKLSVWASWVLPYDRPILLILDEQANWKQASRALIRVGLDNVRGWLKGGFASWREGGLPIAQTPQISAETLQGNLQTNGNWAVVDVRTGEEWKTGHIPGSLHIMGGELPKRLEEIPRNDKPMAVVCRTGYRSTVAASILERAGFAGVYNLTGGMEAWNAAGLPTDRG